MQSICINLYLYKRLKGIPELQYNIKEPLYVFISKNAWVNGINSHIILLYSSLTPHCYLEKKIMASQNVDGHNQRLHFQ